MAQSKTVLKLDIACQKCKTKVLKAVTIEGVDKIEADEAKGTLAVTGTVDPYDIIILARKAVCCAGKYVEVVSIGPPPKPEEKKQPPKKNPDDKNPAPPPPCPCPPYPCPPYGYCEVVVPHETYPPCSIL